MKKMMKPYNREFYKKQSERPITTMLTILKLMNEMLPKFNSMIDFGCGTGLWMKAAKEVGALKVRGIDIVGYDEELFHIPQEEYRQEGLLTIEEVKEPFDLAICLEVAEHLPPTGADKLIKLICSPSDYVLFSAAIPGQGGTGHYNEQWIGYWAEKFEQHGFEGLDCIRWEIWDDQSIPGWYKQNTFLFVKTKQERISNIDYSPKAALKLNMNRILANHMRLKDAVLPAVWKSKVKAAQNKSVSQSTEKPLTQQEKGMLGIQLIREALNMPYRKTEEMLAEEKKIGMDLS